jgi:hypothetical protein
MVESERETDGKVETETRFYNHLARPARQSPGTDDPQSLENGLHWVLDMVFHDDECRPGKARTRCACAAKSPRGTKTPSQPTLPHDPVQSIPLGLEAFGETFEGAGTPATPSPIANNGTTTSLWLGTFMN